MKVLTFSILLGVFLIAGCQSTPTKVFEQPENKAKAGNVISADMIIVDARPPFEFAISHLPGSLNLRWEDFNQKKDPYLGLIDRDVFQHARRLARYGISPQSKILVVGRGSAGKGEEGRTAWMLKVLGIQDVTVRNIDAFSVPLTKAEVPPRESAPIWKPEVNFDLWIEKKDFLKQVMRPKASADYPVVIDVRTEMEYLGKDSTSYFSVAAPDLGGINIPWTEFFQTDGSVNADIQARLQAVNIDKTKRIYVIDEIGTRSAAVVLALRELGFSKAKLVHGGYMYLMKD